jgi:hypothetical protein
MSRSQLITIIQNTFEARLTEVARWFQRLGFPGTLDALKFNPGVTYWAGLLATGASEDSVLNAILSTDDFYNSHGGTPTGFVTGLYQVLLGRAPDPTGLNIFAGLSQAGMSRTDLVALLQNTFEARRTEVARWFQDELGWADPLDDLKVNPGIFYWAGFLVHVG